MNTSKQVTQITPNIFRVDRWETTLEARESRFVREPNEAFLLSPHYACTETAGGLLKFSLDGETVLAETETSFTQGFAIGEKDAIYGLGMHQQQAMNRRNMVCQMVQKNDHIIAVPFLTSNAGYAILFDTCAYMSIGIDKPCTRDYLPEFDTREQSPNIIQIYADDAETFTYYVILGASMAEQIRGYRLLTGKSPLLPRWAYGFFQSREHYKTQAELLQTAHEFRRRGIPLDCIVQDWNYWGDLGWNAMQWDHKKYPAPRAMVDEIHSLDMKLMLSVWSSYGHQTPVCKELESHDMILGRETPEQEPWGRVHDAYDPKASAIVWRYMKENLFSTGLDAWWLDSTEPALGNDCSLDLLQAKDTILGSNRRYLNSYALTVSQNTYRHQREETEQKRVFILTRSGYAGLQKAAAASWTGDVEASWEIFKAQIPALLSFSASGIPYSTTDIGGFFVHFPGCSWESNDNPEYRELYTRWFWFGAFSPLFRSHGTDTPREMWSFGEPGTPWYDAQLAASRLRYALMPYLYSCGFRVYAEDDTLMRPLAMDFPDDPKVLSCEDTYLFGPSLLVHIVTDCQKRKACVYLPAGADWIDYWTGASYPGGATVTVDAPLDQTPLFVRAGSLVLMTEPAACTARQKEETLQVHLYPGKSCGTFYYRDDGDNYRYETGHYARIPFSWEEEQQVLTVGAPQGAAFPLPKALEIYVKDQLVKVCPYDAAPLRLELGSTWDR